MDQCIPCVLRGSANLPVPSQLRFITALLRYRFRLHCVLLCLGSFGAFSHPQGWEEKLILAAAQPRNRVGIHRQRTTPVKVAMPRAATTITLGDASNISFKLLFTSNLEYIQYLCPSSISIYRGMPSPHVSLFYTYLNTNDQLLIRW